ncbi:MAG: phage holin family protein [Firmicutes bacterium]|nr:phage holin family protein [Bacillota bacterium]
MRRNFAWDVLVNAAALYVIARYLVPGVWYSSELAIIIAALVLGVFNAFIRPIFLILTLPFNLITFGLFTFVVNGLMLKFATWFVPGFTIPGFWTTVWVSMLMSLFSAVVNTLAGTRR